MSPAVPVHDLPPLPLTGERTVPGVPAENYWFQRHVAAYAYAAARTRGRRVVDAGSGEGYGAAMLASSATAVTGVELLAPVVAHAREAYPGVSFVEGDICDTGLDAGCADVVVNLQVIEHLPDVPRFLAESRRLLAPGGELIVATPNRLTFSPHSHGPDNLFHVEEFTAAELIDRLERVGGFTVERVLGLYHSGRVADAERAAGRPFTDLVLTDPASWPRWVTTRVAQVTPDDFVLVDATTGDPLTDLDDCLDLIVVAS